MSRTANFSKQVISDAQRNLQKATTIQEFRRAQVILLPATFRLTKAQTAAAIGLSPSRVGALRAEARHPASAPKASHGGRRRQRMTFAAEVASLEPWKKEAETAGLIIVPPPHAALAKQLGEKIHHSQVYRLLARHGWRKVAPDGKHPKSDPAVQEAWKRNSRKWWPNSSKVQLQRAKSPA